MVQLAILGHATRGREVINTLKMLGGKNSRNLLGDVSSHGYYIDSTGKIDYEHYSYFDDDMPFTLEKFLEKYPYKVGDKVQYKGAPSCGSAFEIEKMRWVDNQVNYTILWYKNCRTTVTAEDLQPYKEAPMYLNRKVNEQAEEIAKILESAKEIMEEIKLDIPDGYEFFGIDDDNKVVLTKKQPKYPKTYEECCKILNWNYRDYDRVGYNSELLCKFQILLLCRDAYWKIAGEQMGLGKPWEPDYLNPTKEIRYFIFCTGISIEKEQGLFPTNKILIFPTEEMRDTFYENFKELIELCKEFL